MTHKTTFMVVFALLLSSVVFADVPRIMNYQGKLTDIEGIGVNDTMPIVFLLYDTSEGGSPMWLDTVEVKIFKGLFSAQLDLSINGGDTLKFDRPYWMEIIVNDETMSPREKLATVSYSYRSIYCDTADYAPAGGGQILYDAIVAPSGGDYTSIGDALADGKKRIFVRAGTYNEDKLTINYDGTLIEGERRGTVIINSNESSGSTDARAIEINANGVTLKNLKIVGHDTDGNLDTYFLIYISGGYNGIEILNCDFEKPQGGVLYGNGSQIQMKNCIVDATAKTISLEYLISDIAGGGGKSGSVISGCQFLLQTVNDDIMGVFSEIRGMIEGCTITGRRITGYLSTYGGSMNGCWIRGKNQYWGGGLYSNNKFDNNGMDPGTGASDFMVEIQGMGWWKSNYFYTDCYARKPVKITGNYIVFEGNTIELGTKILIDGLSTQFTNNIWLPSAVSQPMDLELGTSSGHCQCNENILKGTGTTPTITDNGSANKVLNNILYY